jgi:hypothetical protein
MSSLIRVSALGIALAALVAASQPIWAGAAKTVPENQAVTTDLGGNASAVTYWTSQPEGAVVVTTVDTVSGAQTDAESHSVVRLQSTLQPGQVQEISVPLALGETQPVLRIERIADLVTVSKVSQ